MSSMSFVGQRVFLEKEGSGVVVSVDFSEESFFVLLHNPGEGPRIVKRGFGEVTFTSLQAVFAEFGSGGLLSSSPSEACCHLGVVKRLVANLEPESDVERAFLSELSLDVERVERKLWRLILKKTVEEGEPDAYTVELKPSRDCRVCDKPDHEHWAGGTAAGARHDFEPCHDFGD